MNKLVNSQFFKLGAIKFSESFDGLTKLTDVCTYDATLYSDNKPKQCMIRKSETTFRPHLVRHLNMLDDELSKYRDYIQELWDRSLAFVTEQGYTPYQCFLVITSNSYSVLKHTHGEHMGDTITVISTLGEESSDTYLHLDATILQYPEPDTSPVVVCFDGNIIHHTDSRDKNLYFHFVYDLETAVTLPKNQWLRL
jgi:hypothetical protein